MKHHPGQPVEFNAEIQNKVEELALSRTIGQGSSALESRTSLNIHIRGFNTSSSVMDRGSVVQLDDHLIDISSSQGRNDPTLNIMEPAWPDIFGSIGIALEPIPQNKPGKVAIAGVCLANGVFTSGDSHAAPDPADPTQLKSADTGEVRILSQTADNALVCLSLNPIVLWNYERDAAYPGANIKLLELSDDNFSGTATVTLLDPRGYMEDQVAGDKGSCIQYGNKFFAIQASC